MKTLQLELFEVSKKTQAQLQLFQKEHKEQISKRMELDLGTRIKLLKTCMQLRDRIKCPDTKVRMEVNRLINKLDVDGLLKLEALKKFS